MNQVQKARQADLAAYLLSIGEPLTRSGTRHKHKIHDSLVFTKNAYYWNSKGESGNAVDYLTRHMGMNFKTAVAALTSFDYTDDKKNYSGQEKKDVEVAQSYSRVFAYLTKTRGIDSKIVQRLVDCELLNQEAETNNAVFLMKDENGETVGAELEGTLSEKRFKGVRAGSKYGYGFNLRGNETSKTVDYIMFFESVVDLLSFVDLKTNHHGKDLKGCLLVSMAGLKASILEHMQKTFGGKIVLCVDNDAAGDIFAAEIKTKGLEAILAYPEAQFKDWNEQLRATKIFFS